MARILITGGSGFIGTNLVRHCLDQGHEVLNLDTEEVRDGGQASFHRAVNILDRDAVAGIFRDFRPEIVHHLAARTDIDGTTLEDYAANTDGVRNVVAACRESGVRRLVVASSQLVNPLTVVPKDEFDCSPPNAYGASKVETEKIVRAEAEGLEWVLIRPTTIWGPWFGVKYQGLYRQIKAGRFMLPKGRRIQKIWGYVGNAAWSIQKLADLPAERILG
ncbi:MAG: NAD(P)-dependent oxidoreductase, partial [Fimbriimonadaceae bacterium]|nr:NAD(P)-dependent oxidoreductase [Fimbriimonadaceae bacterium]